MIVGTPQTTCLSFLSAGQMARFRAGGAGSVPQAFPHHDDVCPSPHGRALQNEERSADAGRGIAVDAMARPDAGRIAVQSKDVGGRRGPGAVYGLLQRARNLVDPDDEDQDIAPPGHGADPIAVAVDIHDHPVPCDRVGAGEEVVRAVLVHQSLHPLLRDKTGYEGIMWGFQHSCLIEIVFFRVT